MNMLYGALIALLCLLSFGASVVYAFGKREKILSNERIRPLTDKIGVTGMRIVYAGAALSVLGLLFFGGAWAWDLRKKEKTPTEVTI